MTKFDAGSVIEELEYDFTAYLPGVKGVIREPSDKDVEKFMTSLEAAMKELQPSSSPAPVGQNDVDAMLARIADIPVAKVTGFVGEQVKFVAELCGGSPSAEQINALPHRVRVGFIRWLTNEVMQPDLKAPGGNAVATTPQFRRAG